MHLHNKQVLVTWLVGDHLPLRDFGPYGIIFINVCVVMTVATVMLLKDFWPYWIKFMAVCVYCFRFFGHSGRTVH
jgi:hypothetical protein